MSSVEISLNQTVLRSYPVYTDCCGGSPSVTTPEIHKPNLIFMILATCCWTCHKAYTRKDLNCYNATHACGKCGKSLGKYDACQ